MYTQCPECLTIYALTPELLAQANGSVRCGYCTTVFDALRSLSESLLGGVRQLPVHEAARDLPQLSMPLMRPGAGFDASAQADFFPSAASALQSQTSALATPEFVHPRAQRVRAPTWPWYVGIVLLAGIFAVQVGYAQRHDLLNDARVRPLLARACAQFGCTVPLAHDAETLVLLSRDVRPHPSAPDALIISATLRNDSAQTQAFPSVEITLTDLDENRIAMRRFKPAEYLGDARTISAGLASGTATALVFEVVDPGKNAVAYEFKFL